ncbi:hypothetical protein, partial [Klebsiella oxytoca]|uniref:hypothetical protein n=2 Tax=Enterobacteriaceae TaxID=543 RepID=UPI00224842F2
MLALIKKIIALTHRLNVKPVPHGQDVIAVFQYRLPVLAAGRDFPAVSLRAFDHKPIVRAHIVASIVRLQECVARVARVVLARCLYRAAQHSHFILLWMSANNSFQPTPAARLNSG